MVVQEALQEVLHVAVDHSDNTDRETTIRDHNRVMINSKVVCHNNRVQWTLCQDVAVTAATVDQEETHRITRDK